MNRFLIPALVLAFGLGAGAAQAQCCKAKCRARGCADGCCADGGWTPYWCDPYAVLDPWPNDNSLFCGPRYWGWYFPDGGFTAYPGLPGSGVATRSDYSHVSWLASPADTAQAVVQKLDSLGIPRVPQDTTYLGKNPAMVDKAKLPVPKAWRKDAAAAPEKEVEKAKDADKGKDVEKAKEADGK